MPLPEDVKEKIRTLFHEGKLTTVIASELSISRSSVWRVTKGLTRLNSRMKRPYNGGGRPRKINHRRACIMLKDGFTTTEIGLRYDVRGDSVSAHFRKYGTDSTREC